MPPVLTVLALAVLPLFHDTGAHLTVKDAWARETGGRTLSAAVYLTLENNDGEPATVIAARSDIASIVQLHQTRAGDDNIMRMTPVEGIDIDGFGRALLAPGGTHIMLIRLKKPLEKGATFPLTLELESGEAIETSVTVTGIGGPDN